MLEAEAHLDLHFPQQQAEYKGRLENSLCSSRYLIFLLLFFNFSVDSSIFFFPCRLCQQKELLAPNAAAWCHCHRLQVTSTQLSVGPRGQPGHCPDRSTQTQQSTHLQRRQKWLNWTSYFFLKLLDWSGPSRSEWPTQKYLKLLLLPQNMQRIVH